VVTEGFNNTDGLLKNPTLAPTCTSLSPRVTASNTTLPLNLLVAVLRMKYVLGLPSPARDRPVDPNVKSRGFGSSGSVLWWQKVLTIQTAY
jgi:hypothetical protein